MKYISLKLIAGIALAVCTSTSACPYCRDAQISASAPAGNFNSSIIFMLGGLFLAMTMVGRAVVRSAKSV